ncbi:MAG: VOC family protein [Acidimicrobiales bacterium]
MAAHTIDGAVLDHVAHAVPRWQDVWTRYAVDLGAEWSSGGPGPGFAPGQLRFANGARVEILMPYDTVVNDFLVRFLAANGAGPHHLTFKVPDLSSALDTARDAGWEPIGIDVSDPEWLEAFLHPKQATGVVVQLAQQRVAWASPPPDDYPKDRRQRQDGTGPVPPASLLRVNHVVDNLEAATRLFGGLLGGQVVDRGASPGLHWVELAWAGPLGLRLVAPGAEDSDVLRGWIGGRSGRIHHLELAVEEPDALNDARPALSTLAVPTAPVGGPDRWEIAPGANSGLGLVLLPR